ncbi:Rv1733c family protein [Yinghuangia seranimata]|uniref:Rv1733c family protein n=1 Tax=Yinghuangia seranimata TaxID=408067 RepID=UPI00248B96DF|nr:hypothetical protein [Yinghuangia seranimata]MDI2129507.1 hypothetical protein [Yinghuangia seranimata]
MSAKAEQSQGARPTRLRWRWHRNPIRTRGQAAHELFVTMLVLAALALPALGFIAGRAQFDVADARSRRVAAENHPVTAVLQNNVYGSGSSLRGGKTTAAVSWTAADGTVRVGTAAVQSSGDKGDTTTIWLDAAGNPAGAPAPHDRVVLNAIGAGLLTLLGGLGVVLVIYAAEHTAFMRSRMGAWAREWEQLAPEWSRA